MLIDALPVRLQRRISQSSTGLSNDLYVKGLDIVSRLPNKLKPQITAVADDSGDDEVKFKYFIVELPEDDDPVLKSTSDIRAVLRRLREIRDSYAYVFFGAELKFTSGHPRYLIDIDGKYFSFESGRPVVVAHADIQTDGYLSDAATPKWLDAEIHDVTEDYTVDDDTDTEDDQDEQ